MLSKLSIHSRCELKHSVEINIRGKWSFIWILFRTSNHDFHRESCKIKRPTFCAFLHPRILHKYRKIRALFAIVRIVRYLILLWVIRYLFIYLHFPTIFSFFFNNKISKPLWILALLYQISKHQNLTLTRIIIHSKIKRINRFKTRPSNTREPNSTRIVTTSQKQRQPISRCRPETSDTRLNTR